MKVAILGWGVDTQDVEPWLVKQGHEVTILDEKKDGKSFGDLSRFELLVRSPGVYRWREDIKSSGVPVTSKTKLFFDVWPGKIIGVTGTKGKGTTSTLIYEILKSAGKDVRLGGNIGTGLFGEIEKANADSFMVMEMSSFQLIDMTKSPHISVVLMVTQDHLDWHKNIDEYVDAKATITKFQTTSDYAVVNEDYENSRKIGGFGQGQKIWVSGKDWQGETRLRGEHNKENIVAALAVGKILGIDGTEVVKKFKGLEHRLEEVEEVNGVMYFDDSFSTTPETTIAAIKSFHEPMVLIVGGSEKGSDFTKLGEEIAAHKNIKAVVLIGLMAGRINQAILKNKTDLPIIMGCQNMKETVREAKRMIKPGGVVVLSPGCASFDMFKNYKERGDLFKSEVRMSRES